MAPSSSSEDEGSTFSSSRLPTSVPSSPPPKSHEHQPAKPPIMSYTQLRQEQIVAEEERARVANDAAEEKRRKKRRTVMWTKEEREAKAKALDALLAQSAAFSSILTNKTQVLGRVGTALDGKTLGEHSLKMAEQPKCVVGGTMRDYQLEGLTWMYEICLQGMSGILADEMGLGKTVQTISLIALLREKEQYLGPHLVVAPLSTLSNWMNEFHHWVPSIPVVMYHGTPTERRKIFETKISRHLGKNGKPTDKFPVVCTSYEMVLKDKALLSKINWEFIIIDEGHRLKNFDSKLFRELKSFKSATRLLITGTPLQNNLKELWALLNFLLPSIFQDWEAFEGWFDFSDLEDEQGTAEFIADKKKQALVKKMHVVLQPLLLRRIKTDVAKYLPKKREYVLFAPMTAEQVDLYNAISNKNVDTRAYLENKVVERLTGATTSTASSRRASPLSSRSASVKDEPDSEGLEHAAPKADGTVERVKNAFSLMMGKPRPRGRPPKSAAALPIKPAAVVVATPTKPVGRGGKRKAGPVEESPAPKSAKSSRQSTPASTRGRPRRARASYKEAESDEDMLDDDEFEAKLAKEADEEKVVEAEESASAEELERARTLELAKREISTKKLGNPILQLRLVCNSPHNFYNPWSYGGKVDETIVTASGKMLLLDRLLPALFERGHKVLIFSQFKTQLDIIEDYCHDLRGWDVCRIDGGISQDDRSSQIAMFNEDPNMRLFLLSTRAGGQGINLASADTVILFDSDWNPQQDLQAQDRAHRIGQTRPVVVYRLATKGTVEEDLLMSADAKRRLEKLVIKKGGFRTMGQKMDTREELDRETLTALLLKDGEVYKFSGDKEILSDHDLDVLCDRSDAAYERAAVGDGNAAGYKVIETGAEGITAAGES
ncbi:lymphoid-specific helicase [Echria macrotheca]|uniref:Lymphoid-specific helicase n=1 Tax=Echria macrotheca TaxID=438768 RepID=A0AAJ0F8K4_9PEZI|nr:lymphoid-specific helicase [Echria macrotheca]